MKELVALSTFDGISCCYLALERAGNPIAKYYASEINQDSIGITMINNPSIVQLGDICKIDGEKYRGKVNFYAGGSPCQSFSNAGIRNGFDGKSGLFFEWLRLKNEIQPEFWILENVWMKKEWQDVISMYLGVEPIFINSKVASAQSRPRLYWTNIPYTPIEDKGILLGDVIHGAVTGASRHGERNTTGVGPNWVLGDWKYQPDNKSYCVVTGGGQYKNIQGDIKRLTALDCEKLQTVPVGYTAVTGLCNSKRIEALGNAWTVDVLVEAFFKNLPWASNSKVDSTYKKVKV